MCPSIATVRVRTCPFHIVSLLSNRASHLGVRFLVLDLQVIAWCGSGITRGGRRRAWLSPFIAGDTYMVRIASVSSMRFPRRSSSASSQLRQEGRQTNGSHCGAPQCLEYLPHCRRSSGTCMVAREMQSVSERESLESVLAKRTQMRGRSVSKKGGKRYDDVLVTSILEAVNVSKPHAQLPGHNRAGFEALRLCGKLQSQYASCSEPVISSSSTIPLLGLGYEANGPNQASWRTQIYNSARLT